MPSKKPKVHFFSNDIRPNIKNIRPLKLFIESIFKKEKKNLGYINYVFCTDKILRDINRKYLKHDFYTDIITFDLSPDEETIIGEIYISLDRVKENAQNLSENFTTELHRVIFHGALHLCGYKDKTHQQIRKIRGMEDALLIKYFNS